MIQRLVHDTLPVGMIHLKREIEGTLADGGIFECDEQDQPSKWNSRKNDKRQALGTSVNDHVVQVGWNGLRTKG